MHILVFGDSITQGYDDYEKGGWVNRLFIDISAREDKTNKNYISVFNQGIDGNTTTDLLERFELEVSVRKSQEMIIIFDVGGNDAARRGEGAGNTVSPTDFTENYKTLINLAKKEGKVVCLGLHESQKVLTEEDDSVYNEIIQRLATDSGSLYISMKGILSQDFELLTYDGDHPSPRGHTLIYERVKEALEVEGIL